MTTDHLQRLRGHVATVNGSPAEYDDVTGVVRWPRAIGSLDYDVCRHRGTWLDETTWQIDGKTIRFEPAEQTESCRFCGAGDAMHRLCIKCRHELKRWSHEKFAGSGFETPPHEVDFMSKSGLDQWREWAKRMDGGGGSYGSGRQSATDAIFDAAWIGMRRVKSATKDYNKTTAKLLREIANSLERESQ